MRRRRSGRSIRRSRPEPRWSSRGAVSVGSHATAVRPPPATTASHAAVRSGSVGESGNAGAATTVSAAPSRGADSTTATTSASARHRRCPRNAEMINARLSTVHASSIRIHCNALRAAARLRESFLALVQGHPEYRPAAFIATNQRAQCGAELAKLATTPLSGECHQRCAVAAAVLQPLKRCSGRAVDGRCRDEECARSRGPTVDANRRA